MEENLKNQAIRAIKLIPTIPDEISVMISSIDRPGYLADLIASNLNVSVAEKQEILEALSIKERLQKVTVLVNQKIEILELGNKIQSQVKGEIDKTQREYYLREQLKAIQKELGEKDEKTAESEERERRGIGTLPANLWEAIQLTEKSELVRKALGDHVFDAFIRNKKIEWDQYRTQVTDYELKKYLPIL